MLRALLAGVLLAGWLACLSPAEAAPVPLEDNARVGVRLVELEPGLFGGDE